MKERIIEVLENSEVALSVNELNQKLGLSSVEEFKELMKTINQLEDEMMLYQNKNDKYILFSKTNLKHGRLNVNKKGFGFVLIPEEEDVFVSASNLNNAVHNDHVIVEIIKKEGHREEGRVIKIVSRDFGVLVGEYICFKDKSYVKLDDDRMKLYIDIDKKDNKGAMNGHKVIVKIKKKLSGNKYLGEIVEIIGHKEDPGIDILSIAYKYEIPSKFSDEVYEEVETIKDVVQPEDLYNRKDLRQERIVTIDGLDAKDLDDAVIVKKLDNGNYMLGVHIADVSYYVTKGSEIDKEAYERGTSVYLVDRVIPMLPHKLSNGICSLNEGEDRLTMSCEMEIDSVGNVVNYDIFEGVINSKKRMNYTSVNHLLEDGIIDPGYEEFAEELKQMQELAHILRKNKEHRGYIDFDTDEAKVNVDENGKVIDITLRDRGEGQRLIEDFMIAANETVASHIFYMNLPFVYRIHETPMEKKVNSFLDFVSALGYPVMGRHKVYTSKDMQKILDQLHDKKEYKILSSLLLRSMQKAVYSPQNVGHFGLASKNYTHFTSPIRRYPDTTVHRLLRKYLFEHDMSRKSLKDVEGELPVLCEHVSERERAAIDCEREVTDMKMAEYMEDHIGEIFEGMINSVMNFGMFVELDNLIEGLVHMNDMADDFYHFDSRSLTLTGEKTKVTYRVGDRIKVKVIGASKEEKTVDFEIAK